MILKNSSTSFVQKFPTNSVSQTENDLHYMDYALRLGRRHLGQTGPNPSVGCVIVKDGRVLGLGVTAKGGRPHAETQALEMAAHHARGACAYVTLEPCAHHGETGPCAQALSDAGVARVVIALRDPDPRTAGRGVAHLRGAGIQVDEGVRAVEAARDHAGFIKRLIKALPFVSLKLALSLDGNIAAATGESQWITNAQSRRYGHLERAQHDAILIGTGTAEADNPRLNVRLSGLAERAPLRVLLDRQARISQDSQLFETASKNHPLMIFTANMPQNPKKNRHITYVETPERAGALDLLWVLKSLAEGGVNKVLIEGGAKLAAHALERDCVDRIVAFQAGILLGGTGLSGIGALHDRALKDYPSFELFETARLDGNMMSVYHRKNLP